MAEELLLCINSHAEKSPYITVVRIEMKCNPVVDTAGTGMYPEQQYKISRPDVIPEKAHAGDCNADQKKINHKEDNMHR